MTDKIGYSETDVLIVGTGPSGATASLALASYGISNICISKYSTSSPTPRAHITNQRTMEILRHFDLESQALAVATPQHLMGDQVYCTSLAGLEIARIKTWHTQPRFKAQHDLISPCSMVDLTQDLLEPILLAGAMRAGSRIRFDTELADFVQDEDGVTATLLDRLTGATSTVRAKYLIGADGARSIVANKLDLPLKGPSNVAASVGFYFDADLSHLMEHRSGVLYWIFQPGNGIGGYPIGGLRMVRPWHRWVASWGHDIASGPPQYTDEEAVAVIHRLIGDTSVPVKIRGIYTWPMNRVQAEAYGRGRVFCMGDAVHRHPPMNGLGTNTSIQDAFNLAWKLAYVVRSDAGSGLLDSYEAERMPIGHDLVRRAFDNFSVYAPVAEALGFTRGEQPAERFDTLAERLADPSPEGAKRRADLRDAVANNVIGFSALGGEHNQFYRSNAVIPDDQNLTIEDPELHVIFGVEAGRRLPHVWLTRHQQRVSSLDICQPGRFTLLTGIAGGAWFDAVTQVIADKALPLDVVQVGPGQIWQDVYGDFARLCLPDETGAVLVRPDLYVAWHMATQPSDPAEALKAALDGVLGLAPAA
ncbi:FAD-dependent monooxygenase [Sphingomonas sp. UYEF23]|uniref:FAD-dependent oxidoreductase n=1 Tax=Sphingomonas sp. UYEF23 TaxID=1756408 RepID=UPI00339612B0